MKSNSSENDKKRITYLENKIQEMENKIQEMEKNSKNIAKMEVKYKKMKKAFSESISKHQNSKEWMKRYKIKNTDLRISLKEEENKYSILKNENQRLKRQIKDQKEQVSSQTKQLVVTCFVLFLSKSTKCLIVTSHPEESEKKALFSIFLYFFYFCPKNKENNFFL